ncbi:MAG TPA: type II CAAX endopeptidase family protein [Levilinea sp.]|nr:type II CAAX endopeptidase family protein [Levilinea sp.]
MNRQAALRPVNLLYLVVMVFMLANLALSFIPQFVRLNLNEALLIFLPAYLFLRFFEKDTTHTLAERVRWRWPGWKVGLLSLVIGIGLYPISITLATIFQQVLGYTDLVDPGTVLPTTVGAAVLAVIAYAVMAPLCEEFFFRGVMQPVYERRFGKWAVLFVGFLFIAFHLSLLQGISIILITLALGYVNYQTRSLQASILTHFGANGMAALVITDGVFKTGAQTWLLSPNTIVAGVLIAVLSLIWLLRFTRQPSEAKVETPVVETEIAAQPEAPRRGWLRVYWPILVALLFIWLPLISVEVVFSRSPELLEQLTGVEQPGEPLVVDPVPWQGSEQWRYEIRNIVGDVVGEGTCQIGAAEPALTVTCVSFVEVYDVEYNGGRFLSSGGSRSDLLTWDRAGSRVSGGVTAMDLSSSTFQSETAWSLSDGALMVEYADSNSVSADVSLLLEDDENVLLAHANIWPWHLAGVRFDEKPAGRVVRFHPYTWRNATQDQGPVAEARRLAVLGEEVVETPAGTFTAWKVTIGRDETAWYDISNGVTVVKFFNGMETWNLK